MQKKYPFKFLNAYERDDIDFFFGRDEEINDLYQMVFQSNLVLVYGKSGTGKTSLIQCGLANRFKSYDWLALYIRKGENLLSSLDKKLCEESDGAFEYQERTEASGKAQQTIENLAEKIDAVYKASFKPIYLIFDQFEELYTLRNQPGEQQHFIKVVQQLLELNQPVKIIISIREEYLGYLYDFERAVPELLRKKLRVDAMHRDKVKSLLIKIGDSEESNVHLDQNEKEDIAGKIFDIVRGEEKALSIQLPYLQVFMEKVYLEKTRDESKATEATFTMADLNKIGTLGDVLRDFLDIQVKKIAHKLKQKKEETIWTILSPFVSLDGTKRPITVKELEADLPNISPKLIEEALEDLEDNRIVRFLEKEERYEISHDSLAKQIDARRSDDQKQIMQVKRLIHSQTDLPIETRQFFNENTLALLDAAKELYQPTSVEQEWIDKSRSKLAADEAEKEAKRAKELAEAKARAEKEAHLRADAEAQKKVAEGNEKKAQKRTRLAVILSVFVGLAMVAAIVLGLRAVKAEEEALSAEIETQKALEKAENFVNAFDFYADRFALAYKNRVYFIDKEGNRVEKLAIWEKANQFNLQGFAEVTQGDSEYYLDTFGTEHLIHYDLPASNKNKILALDLSEFNSKKGTLDFSEFKQLKILLLNSPDLDTTFLKGIETLTSLNWLKLGNGLSAIPKEIGQLKKLRSLDLSSNELSALPKEIGQLKNLVSLDLNLNQLSALPKEIGQLEKLISLVVSDNRLEELPNEIVGLRSLTSLNLSFNQFTELPNEIDSLQNLISLDLSSNQLTTLPKSINQLQNLTSLVVSDNGLEKIPKEIGQLQNLISLDLSSNQLTTLPEGINQLQNLTSLNLSYNPNLDTIRVKEQIAGLEKLTDLNFGSIQLAEAKPTDSSTVIDAPKRDINVIEAPKQPTPNRNNPTPAPTSTPKPVISVVETITFLIKITTQDVETAGTRGHVKVRLYSDRGYYTSYFNLTPNNFGRGSTTTFVIEPYIKRDGKYVSIPREDFGSINKVRLNLITEKTNAWCVESVEVWEGDTSQGQSNCFLFDTCLDEGGNPNYKTFAYSSGWCH